MARIDGIKKRLEQHNIDSRTTEEIIGSKNLIDAIIQMENLLPPDIVYEILDSCACLGGQNYINQCKKTGKDLLHKSLWEKADYLNNNIYNTEKITLNGNNLITGTFLYSEDTRYKCFCSAAVQKGMPVSALADDPSARAMPLSYCLCCAGSFRRHLQLQLSIKLETKEIISSPINSKGEKPCQFIFEIV